MVASANKQPAGLVDIVRMLLREPELRLLDAEDVALTEAHRKILARKPLAQELFAGFCQRCVRADEQYFADCRALARLELGSGSGIIKTVDPRVITSEI